MENSSSNDFDQMVETITEKCFHGYLPPYAERIRNAVMCSLPIVRDAPEPDRQYFAENLLIALNDRIRAQDVAKNEFKN